MMKLRVAERDDLEIIYSMQKEAFAPLYEKYQDTETSPATEPFERTIQRFNNINVTYYLIVVEEKTIGAIRVRKNEKTYVLVQILILPEYQNKGYAQQAIKEVEALREDAECWRLDTIEQEEKLCHLYAKMGYHKTGETEHVKDGMDLVFFEKRVEH